MLPRKISHYLRKPQMPSESLDWSYIENGLDTIGRKKKYLKYVEQGQLYLSTLCLKNAKFRKDSLIFAVAFVFVDNANSNFIFFMVCVYFFVFQTRYFKFNSRIMA
jgi:hypothetical protein